MAAKLKSLSSTLVRAQQVVPISPVPTADPVERQSLGAKPLAAIEKRHHHHHHHHHHHRHHQQQQQQEQNHQHHRAGAREKLVVSSSRGEGGEGGEGHEGMESSEQEQEQGGDEEGGAGRLLAGVPDEITLDHVLTKLPWTTLYVLSSLNRAWREAVLSRSVYNARVRTNTSQTLVAIFHEPPASVIMTGRKTAISVYDPSTDRWHLLPPIPDVRSGIPSSCGCVCLDGELYILGGYDENKHGENWIARNQVHSFDLGSAQRAWKQCASMYGKRINFSCAVKDGKIYVFGGQASFRGVFSEKSEVYNPKQNSWHFIAPVLHHCLGRKAIVAEGEIYVHGGSFHNQLDADFAEVYDCRKDQWRELKNFTHPEQSIRSDRLVVIDGKLHEIYGNYLLVHDAATNSWKATQYISWDVLERFQANHFRADEAVAVNGELLSLGCWKKFRIRRTEYGMQQMILGMGQILLRSKGLGCKDRQLDWEIVNCPYSFWIMSYCLCLVRV
ncbi:hypothetical protein MPTK1_1g25730 [Marchantia polymorpha subsp. ruderalis]